MAIAPVVRHLILCDDVSTSPAGKFTLHGLVSAIRSSRTPPYPHRHPLLCVFMQLTNGRGQGQLKVEIRELASGVVVAYISPRVATLPTNPLAVYGGAIRLQDIPFPNPGAIRRGAVVRRCRHRP